MKFRVLVICLGSISIAQGVSGQHTPIETCVPEGEEVYSIVEQMPRFPGGEAELFRYLGKALSIPRDAGDENPPSRLHVSFVVLHDGRICGVEVLRGGSTALVDQVRTMIYAMPTWEPGLQRGKPVNVRYSLPIHIHWK
ncbi:MAG TPA: energy transducer TonB [Flavobacteriales bacterium]|nr:energy transducer TonB [Flavobacteriales bacterium]